MTKDSYLTVNLHNIDDDKNGVLTAYPASIIDVNKSYTNNDLNVTSTDEQPNFKLEKLVNELESLDIDELETLLIGINIDKDEKTENSLDYINNTETSLMCYCNSYIPISTKLGIVSLISNGLNQFSMFSDYGVIYAINTSILSEISMFISSIDHFEKEKDSEEMTTNILNLLFNLIQSYKELYNNIFHYNLLMYNQILNFNGISNFKIDTSLINDSDFMLDLDQVKYTLAYLLFQNEFDSVNTLYSIISHPIYGSSFQEKVGKCKTADQFSNLVKEYKTKISN